MHYGVTGQKWGVRRYQNPDGSLTPEGRQHYGLGDLDYNARYSGDKKTAKKAYKAERKALRNKVFDAYDIDEKEWDNDYANLDKDENIGDHHEYRNAEKELFETSDKMYSSYEAGLKEVDRYLAGKYGQETINSIKRGDKAKTIAIGVGAVAGSTILGMGVWHGTKAYKNNQLREFEDSAYKQMDDARYDYEKAKENREWRRNRESDARERARKSRNYYLNERDPKFKDTQRKIYEYDKAEYEKAQREAMDAAERQAYGEMRFTERADRYDKNARERAEKISGLWRRKSDNERDNRYTEFMKRHV